MVDKREFTPVYLDYWDVSGKRRAFALREFTQPEDRAVVGSIALLVGGTLLDGTAHIENQLPRDFALSHLEDVHEPHFNLRVSRPGPIPGSRNFEGHDAVVYDTILGREALEEFEAHVAHRCEELAVVLRNGLFPREGSIEAVKGWRIPDDVVGIEVERGFDLVDGLTVKVLLDALQVSSNPVIVHRFLLLCRLPRLVRRRATHGPAEPKARQR